ncbi:MAG: hypothetical protein QXU98_03635 [Candidatus Parvarchaeota archaeon]
MPAQLILQQATRPPFPYVVFSQTYPQTIYTMPANGNEYWVVVTPSFVTPIEQEFVMLTMLTHNNYLSLNDIQIVYANQYTPGVDLYTSKSQAVGFEYGYTTPVNVNGSHVGAIQNYYGTPFNVEPTINPYIQTIIPSLTYGQQFYVAYLVNTSSETQNTPNQPPPSATLLVPRLILVML